MVSTKSLSSIPYRSIAKIFPLLLATLLSVALSGCDKEPESTEAALRPVRYITVSNPADFRNRTFTGSSKFVKETRLSFKVPGTVEQIPVQVGDELSAGDLVARLEPSQYELQVQQSQASLMQSQANARNAQAYYERVKGLYENNNASRNDLDGARASAESAKAQQRASQKALELGRLNLSYTRLSVDSDCSIAELSVEENENVSAGNQVAQVTCGEELEVSLEVPEGLIADIYQHMPVDIQFDAFPDTIFKGKVFEVGVSSTETATTFLVSVQLNQSNSSLRSGLAAEVTFSFASNVKQEVYLVPLAAIINDLNGPFIFMAEPVTDADASDQALVRRQSVQLGELTEDGMEILNGLNVGDRLITSGVSVIRDGQRVLLP